MYPWESVGIGMGGFLSIATAYAGIPVYTEYVKTCIKQVAGYVSLSTAPVAAWGEISVTCKYNLKFSLNDYTNWQSLSITS